MKNRLNSIQRRLAPWAAALAVAAAAVLVPAPAAHADDLPAPTVRRSPKAARGSTSATPRRTHASRTTTSRTTTSRTQTTRTVRRTGTRPYGTPYVRPASEHGEPRCGVTGRTQAVAARTKAHAPSEPIGWSIRKRHSTYVPPAHTAPQRGDVATRGARGAAGSGARAKRTVLAQGRSTYVAPARTRVAAAPTVRKTSPSYEQLRRTQAESTASRSHAGSSAAWKRRNLQRRSTATSRRSARSAPRQAMPRTTTAPRSRAGRAGSVPAAPGEQCQPQPSSRRLLELRPRPGCTADG